MICTPGGTAASAGALDKRTGGTVWATKNLHAPSTHCTPALTRHGGRDLIVTQLKGLVVGIDAATGEVLWRYVK